MPNFTKRRKASKPYLSFPLFPHRSGRWCKKIRQRFHYFGKVTDDDDFGAMTALDKYQEVAADLHAGRTPRPRGDGLKLADVVNRFLTWKRSQVDAGELELQSWRGYLLACERMIRVLGRDRLASDIDAQDFERLRDAMAETLGPAARKVEITRTKTIFRHAYESGLIEQPPRFGPGFKAPSQRILRKVRNGRKPRILEAAELRTILDAATVQMRAMVLLGLNAGMGNSDLARMRRDALDLKKKWLDYPRPKTGVPRRCPLWPETVKAIREHLADPPLPQDPANTDLVFLTARGEPWVAISGKSSINRLSGRFGDFLKRLNLGRDGIGFYALRRVFRTVADETRDFPAIDVIMGHADHTMAGHYRERIDDSRLIAVVEHVRRWLFNPKKPR